MKNLNNANIREHEEFALRVLRSNCNKQQLAVIEASSPDRQELVEGSLSILCERAFMLKLKLRAKRLAKKHGVASLALRIDDYADWNTLRRLLGHSASTGTFRGLWMAASKEASK